MKNKKLEAWANKELKKIQKILLLDAYLLSPISLGVENPRSICECKFSYPYKNIEITYSDSFIWYFNNRKKDARGILIHEMCHALTDELYSKSLDRYTTEQTIRDARELLTDHIANIVIKNLTK